jgi:tetratricopeptide (TPR) repeat protein
VTLFALFSAYRLLPRFVHDLTADDPLNRVYYTTVQLFGTAIEIPRPAGEVRSELQNLISSGSSDTNLYRLLAEQDERNLDFASAEAHLRQFLARSSDKAAAYGVLAGFYEKHLRFSEAVNALLNQADAVRAEPSDVPLLQRVRYHSLHHAIQLVESRKLQNPGALTLFRKLLEIYPDEAVVHREALSAYLERKQHREALLLLEQYRAKFPQDAEFALLSQARLLESQSNLDAAINLFGQSYQPRWSDSLLNEYLALLQRARKFETFVQWLGEKLKANPTDFVSATLLFRSTLNQGNLEAARNVLFRFRSEKESRNERFTNGELQTLGHYFYSLNHFNEAARYFSTLALQTQDLEIRETSLFQLYQVMQDALNRPTQLGGGGLDYFRSVATVDTNPGLLNGLLSLILNRTHPRSRYDEAEERAIAYFNRAHAAELLEFFETSFPNSTKLARMQYQALEALKAYGRWETIVQRGADFLIRHPESLEAPAVGLLMADAYANLKNDTEEFKVYDRLLTLLNSRPHRFVANPQMAASSVALRLQARTGTDNAEPAYSGEVEDPVQFQPTDVSQTMVTGSSSAVWDRTEVETARLKTIDYSYVLERNISRLTAAQRYLDAVAIFRKELERNPDEEALYARFAEYLNQHRFLDQEMEIYNQAIQRFNKSSWYDKLARWYLRQRRQSDFAVLSRRFVDAFKGTELEEYFASVVSQVRPQAFYEELNLYANRRFPHNPVFARNLAELYLSSSRTYPQWEAIAQKYFFEDRQIRERYYSYLSRRGRLQPMMAELAAVQERNLLQTRFLADALAWRSNFEQSASHYQLLASRYPTDPETINLVSDLLRSLGAFDARQTVGSAKLRENLAAWNPDDREALTRIGETYCDLEAYGSARQAWLRIPAINVSDQALHLEAATLFWDYYLFDDSLKAIQEYRRHSENPTALSYEAGAIYEDGQEISKVIEEYVKAAAAGRPRSGGAANLYQASGGFVPGDGDERAYRRLRFLASRRKLGDQIDAEFRKRIQSDTQENTFALAYGRYLQSQLRYDDLRKFLLERVTAARDRRLLNEVQPMLRQHGFFEVQEAGLKRQIELTSVAEQRLSVELELARFYEDRGRTGEARALLERLQAGQPKSLGLIQDLEAFYWRRQLQDKAIALLERSIPLANANYRRQFRFDEAHKLVSMKQYDRAIQLGQQLLQEDPLNETNTNFLARVLAQAGRHSDLPAFYSDRLQAIRQSSLPAEDRKKRILAFRRGIVEAQIILKDFTAALDQHIEILNLDAEDLQSVNEACDFAREHQLESRLRDYYQNTAKQSPQDHRWPLLLARCEDRWGNLADSLQQVEAAIRIRPERIDLHQAKVSLQLRLLDFPSAIRTYQRLYELSYKDAAYLLNIAEMQARLGNKAAAIEALKTGYFVDAGLPAPQYFKVVDQLNRWGFLDEAKPLIDEGWKRFTQRSGSDFMGAADLLRPAVDVSVQRRDVENTVHALRAEYHRLESIKGRPGGMHAQANQETVSQAFQDLGAAIDRYFGPDEKARIQSFLEKIQPPFTVQEKEILTLKLAQNAGLAELQEAWLISLAGVYGQRLLPNSSEQDRRYRQVLGQLTDFYRRRQAYEKAAVSLVALWERNPQRHRMFSDLVEPALAARKLGDKPLEMSILEKYANASGGLFSPPVLQRYYELLGDLNEEARIVQISQRDTRLIAGLVNVLIDRNKLALARTVLENYGRHKTPVWTATQLAMTGAYLNDATPPVAAGFSAVLNLKPIGELVGMPADVDRLLYGGEWYFYARRLGEYLYLLKSSQAEEVLAAQTEFAPVSSSRQSQLGAFYLTNNQLAKAQAQFTQALELEPTNTEALDGQAVVWMKQNEIGKAQENWRKLLDKQDQQFSWPDLELVLRRIREFKLEAAFRQPVEAFLKTYVKRNQTYGLEKVLPAVLPIFETAETKVALLTVAARQTETFPFVQRLVRLSQIEEAGLPLQPVYELAIEWQQNRLKNFGGEDRNFQTTQLMEFELVFAEFLLKSKGQSQAEPLLDRVERELVSLRGPDVDLAYDPMAKRVRFLRAQHYIQTNRAEAAKSLLQSIYQRSGPIESRREDYLKAADILRQGRLPVAARAVRAELYEELIDSDSMVNASYLGLAEVFLEGKQVAWALAVLERLLTVKVDNLEAYRLAAELQWKYRSTKLESGNATLGDKAQEAWRKLLQLNPADLDTKLRLAEAGGTAELASTQSLLRSVAGERRSSYFQKAEAARIAGKTGVQDLPFAGAELRAIAEIERRRNAPKGTLQATPAVQLPSGFHGPIYVARSPSVPGTVPSLESLRQALFLRPMTGGTLDRLNSRLFAELIQRFEQEKKWGLLIDLFEQYGSTSRRDSHFQYQDPGGIEDGGLFGEAALESGEAYAGPQPLASFSLTPSEKLALVKAVIDAYSNLEAYEQAAETAFAAASIAASRRAAFRQQARQLDVRALQLHESWAVRFSVNDTLGEELSQRKPLSPPRPSRVRS